jgi:SAM-dependent methyltransferase
LSRALHRRFAGFDDARFASGTCSACGHAAGFAMKGVLWPDLVLQWQLGAALANWMDQREGLRCRHCRSNLRSRHLALSIVLTMNECLGTRAKTLPELCADPRMQALKIAEINAAGDLHPFLQVLPHLRYSEFGSTAHNVPSEDLLNLSYTDSSFTLVITSDVLEHVPDADRALREIRRILEPDGLHIFTVPIVWSQPRSRRRAELRGGMIVHRLPPSHHGAESSARNDFLVFEEFGQDFVQRCEAAGFAVKVLKDARNPSVATLVARCLAAAPH